MPPLGLVSNLTVLCIALLYTLGFGHISMLGRYIFVLPDTFARGELRPLRDPKTAGIEDP